MRLLLQVSVQTEVKLEPEASEECSQHVSEAAAWKVRGDRWTRPERAFIKDWTALSDPRTYLNFLGSNLMHWLSVHSSLLLSSQKSLGTWITLLLSVTTPCAEAGSMKVRARTGRAVIRHNSRIAAEAEVARTKSGTSESPTKMMLLSTTHGLRRLKRETTI